MQQHVHVVEDEQTIGLYLEYLFNHRGYVPHIHRSAAAFLADDKAPCDLLLTDLLLPGMDGFRLCSTVRKKQGFEHMPIIAMTGLHWDDGVEVRLRSSYGVLGLLRKPISVDALFATVAQALKPPAEPRSAEPQNAEPRSAGAQPAPAAQERPGFDGRSFSRVEVAIPIEFASADAFVREYTRNISAGGMFIVTRERPPKDGRVELQVRIPTLTEPLCMPAQVVHAQADGFGVQLADVDQKTLAHWFNVLKSHQH